MARWISISNFLPPMIHINRIPREIGHKAVGLIARLPLDRRECVICERKFLRFLPYRGGVCLSPLLAELDVIGSDLENFSCPWCYSHDRERHLLLFMRAAGIFTFCKGKQVLHFAPEMHLTHLIEEANTASFVRGDLSPWAPDMVKLDLMNIPYSDESFDLVIANHVLEHVENDRSAVAEIARVLRPGGYAILQTPYSEMLDRTWEDSGILSRQARRLAFGQEDHVRLFGKDIFERIAQQGLKPEIRTHHELLSGYSPRRYGLNEQEPFFLFLKPERAPN